MPHETSRRRVLALAAGVLAGSGAGCIGAGTPADGGGTGELGDPATRVEVTAASVPEPKVDPALVHVEPGGTVVWQGEGVRNTVATYHPEIRGPQRIPDEAEPWISDLLRSGSTFEVTFNREGVYDYVDTTEICGTHEAYGVVGRIVVGRPDLDGEPAIEADNDKLPSRAVTVMDEFDKACRAELGTE